MKHSLKFSLKSRFLFKELTFEPSPAANGDNELSLKLFVNLLGESPKYMTTNGAGKDLVLRLIVKFSLA